MPLPVNRIIIITNTKDIDIIIIGSESYDSVVFFVIFFVIFLDKPALVISICSLINSCFIIAVFMGDGDIACVACGDGDVVGDGCGDGDDARGDGDNDFILE